MDVCLIVHGQMIVYDVLHGGKVQSARGKVGADEHIGASALETEQGPLPVLLLHGTMECTDTEARLVQKLIDTVHGLAIVQEDDAWGAS